MGVCDYPNVTLYNHLDLPFFDVFLQLTLLARLYARH